MGSRPLANDGRCVASQPPLPLIAIMVSMMLKLHSRFVVEGRGIRRKGHSRSRSASRPICFLFSLHSFTDNARRALSPGPDRPKYDEFNPKIFGPHPTGACPDPGIPASSYNTITSPPSATLQPLETLQPPRDGEMSLARFSPNSRVSSPARFGRQSRTDAKFTPRSTHSPMHPPSWKYDLSLPHPRWRVKIGKPYFPLRLRPGCHRLLIYP